MLLALTPKYRTQAPREILALRSLDQGPPGDLASRAKACLLGKIPEELSWRPWWSEVMENWSLRKPEHSKRNWDERDQLEQLEQGHQGQVRADRSILLFIPRHMTHDKDLVSPHNKETTYTGVLWRHYLYCLGHKIKWSGVCFVPETTGSTETFPSRTLRIASWQLGTRTAWDKAVLAITGGDMNLSTSSPSHSSQGSPVARNSPIAWSEQGTQKGQVRQGPEAGPRSREPW